MHHNAYKRQKVTQLKGRHENSLYNSFSPPGQNEHKLGSTKTRFHSSTFIYWQRVGL